MFAAWGHLVYRRRWLVLLASVLLLVGSGVALRAGGTLGNGNSFDTESGRAIKLLGSELPRGDNGATVSIVFSSPRWRASDPRFRQALERALAPLRPDRRVVSILTPYSAGPQQAALISRTGRDALVTLVLRDTVGGARDYYPALRAKVHSPVLATHAMGDLAITSAFDVTLAHDLQRAERVALPASLVLLLLVFGTVVAALLPLGVGVMGVVGGVAGVYLLTHLTDVSQYALNIVTLIGLGVAIDYSLFIVTRFREELARGGSVEDALVVAMATAGRAITFSGMTVAIGLGALLFYRGTFLASMGAAGAIVVAFAVVYALTFLPALLALLGPRVGAWRLPLPRLSRPGGRGLWRTLADAVMRRPLAFLAVALPVLLIAGTPFLHLHLASASIAALPTNDDAHQGYDLLVKEFPGQDKTRITVVVRFPSMAPPTAARIGALYDLSRAIARLPDVLRVEGPVDAAPSLTRGAYQALYTGPRDRIPPPLRAGLVSSMGPHIAVLTVLTARQVASDEARALVRAIRAIHKAGDGEILVTGETAYDIDQIALILGHTPAALAFIMVMTYVVLFLLLGSVILPLKAVLTDVLSISASFGALVWVFQEGHFSTWMNFTPAPLDPSVPVLLFCIVFGLSMDYEVLLLSRVKEEYERSGDTTAAIAEGLERSGRLITGAAAIMVVVFSAFALADVVIIKAIGLGMSLAVAVDATIVRALVVPAIMRLLGDLNWWAPRPLARLYTRFNLGESGMHGAARVPRDATAEV